MRIAFCITDLDIGGAEQAMVEVVVRLAAAGNTCRVIVLQPPPERLRLVERLDQAGVDVAFLDARHIWHVLRTMRRLSQQLRSFQPQIVQSFLHHANILSILTAKRAGIPHVVTGIRVAERRRNFHRKLAQRTDHLVDRHVCVSQAVADFAEKEMGLSAGKLTVIPNGVDLARFQDAKPIALDTLGVPQGRRAIVFVGRLDEQKRLDWLIAQMPKIARRLLLHDLILVGEGPCRVELEEQADFCELSDRIHFVGWQGNIPGILAAAEMLVLTSAWEGMPNVILEAMAAGLPVVTTACEGVAELLGDATDEQVVAIDNAFGFVSTVEQIATDSTLAMKLGAANRSRAEHFSWDTTAAAYSRLYQGLSSNGERDA